MLSILIQEPKQPGNDIDVFLEPLLEDMAKLWNDGELVWDEFKQECFTLRAMIFVAITDYPGGFSLLGQMTGKRGCLVCLGDTQYMYIFGSKKLVYMRSRRFLPPRHRYRKMRKEFDGIKGKTKEGLKSRKDFVDLNIRHELHPEERANGKYYLLAASYNLTNDEKKAICKCLRGVRVPTGYSSNIKNLVSMKDLKIVSMKSHDCHVMMTQMLPIAIRCIKPDYVKLAVTRLCHFFNAIAYKVIDPTQ